MIEKKSIILGITGSAAAYKACELARLFVKGGYDVTALLTENACRLVTPLQLATLTGNETYTDMWQRDNYEMGHISLKEKAKLLVIAPATANIIAKCAHGIADDLLSTTFLSVSCPVLIAPAMNPFMWKNPATQDNVALLKKREILFCGPENGIVACGDTGEGKMSSVEYIYEKAVELVQ
jgi:phosphopantothenoylcysteine decarboxylase / phosphopantothenate---cysteine ligase